MSGPPLVPSKIGPARRNHHIVEQLARYYEVSVLATGRDTEVATFLSSCRAPVADVRFVPSRLGYRLKIPLKMLRTVTGHCDFLYGLEPELRRLCVDMTTAGAIDAVVLSSVLLRSLPVPDALPVIADTHNVEFDLHRRTAAVADDTLRRLYAKWQTRCTRREERRCGAQVDLLLATSEHDRQLFESDLQISHVAVVPNGIDLQEFRPLPPAPARPVILFSGLMSYYPNQHGIRWFLDKVFPTVVCHVPDARLVIAGAAPPEWLLARRDSRVDVTGQVCDIRPYLAAATVVIAPLRIGGGTRVKILEAQSMLRPVVSTVVGAEGLAQRDDETIVIADDAASFARHVVRMLRERDRASRIAENGRRHVVEHFNWDAIGDRLTRTLDARLGLSRRG